MQSIWYAQLTVMVVWLCTTAKGDGVFSRVGRLGDIFKWISNQSAELISWPRGNGRSWTVISKSDVYTLFSAWNFVYWVFWNICYRLNFDECSDRWVAMSLLLYFSFILLVTLSVDISLLYALNLLLNLSFILSIHLCPFYISPLCAGSLKQLHCW